MVRLQQLARTFGVKDRPDLAIDVRNILFSSIL